MRFPGVLFAALAFVACTAPPDMRSESRAASSAQALAPELQTAVQFLLGAAADDFHTHGSPRTALFRNVRIGHVVGPDGTRRYVLCGLCSPAGKADWTPFATIKTSGYEQYIGVQAGAYCQSPPVVWDENVGDLSSSLGSRLASLR
jgi:hypothetical protein